MSGPPEEIPSALRAACERALEVEADLRRTEGDRASEERRDRLLLGTYAALRGWWQGELTEKDAIDQVEALIRAAAPSPS